MFEAALLGFLVRVPKRGKKQLLKAVGLALVAGLLAAWLGVGWTVERFESSTPGEISRDRRVSMFRDTWQIFLHHPWAGTGLGTLETVYPRYESHYGGLVVDHAHNDYLELLADTGLVGGVCVLAFIALLFQRALSNLRSAKNLVSRSFYAGALVACTGLLVHSLVDFNMHIPANALLFLLLAGLAMSGMAEAEADQPCASALITSVLA
jgi:O-antigen ligase